MPPACPQWGARGSAVNLRQAGGSGAVAWAGRFAVGGGSSFDRGAVGVWSARAGHGFAFRSHGVCVRYSLLSSG